MIEKIEKIIEIKADDDGTYQLTQDGKLVMKGLDVYTASRLADECRTKVEEKEC